MAIQYTNHDLRSADGGTIYMPAYIGGEENWGNLAIPDVHVVTATQQYPRGTIFRKGGKTWVYTKLATTTKTTGYGAYAGGTGLFTNGVGLSITSTTGSAQLGATTLTTTTTMVANAYAGGLLTIFETGQPIGILSIVSNTTTVVTLESKLPGTYTSGATAWVTPGPYHEAIIPGVSMVAGQTFEACVGVLNSPLDEDGNEVAAGDFTWLQTWGICNMWASGTYEGDAANERNVIVEGDGAAQILTDTLIETLASFQQIGFLLTYTGKAASNVGEHGYNTGGQATTIMNHIIFLQITP